MNFLKKIQNKIDDALHYSGHYYVYTILALHILYVLVLVGVLSMNSIYFRLFNIFIQLFICIFLMFRFHPFRKHELREYDAKIIFSSAAFLLFNLGVVEYIKSYGTNLLEYI
jgi:hypothetical protein